jgi:hypothetical protein
VVPVALLVGAYRRVGWATMLATWLIAVPIGLVGRSVIRGGPWGEGLLEFGAIAMASRSCSWSRVGRS